MMYGCEHLGLIKGPPTDVLWPALVFVIEPSVPQLISYDTLLYLWLPHSMARCEQTNLEMSNCDHISQDGFLYQAWTGSKGEWGGAFLQVLTK